MQYIMIMKFILKIERTSVLICVFSPPDDEEENAVWCKQNILAISYLYFIYAFYWYFYSNCPGNAAAGGGFGDALRICETAV